MFSARSVPFTTSLPPLSPHIYEFLSDFLIPNSAVISSYILQKGFSKSFELGRCNTIAGIVLLYDDCDGLVIVVIMQRNFTLNHIGVVYIGLFLHPHVNSCDNMIMIVYL